MTRIGYVTAAVAVVALVAAAVFLLRERPLGGEDGPPRDSLQAAEVRTGSDEIGLAAAIVNDPAPHFALPTLEGDTLSMTDLKGQVVVINFWATWCAPCRVEIPELIEMQDELADDGVRFVGIALEAEAVDAVRAYADDADFNYPIAIDDGEVANRFGGVYALPTTILIDREGMVVRKISGLVTKNLLQPILEDLARG